ncbi:hypothetical protein GCM10011360_00410 [Primorskyibacter flagellatus]|uniref:Uncharacterized protein n=1 Tax=Primorskyibacter flagellatus TaxID=1387277 RepID=A0A917E8V8_9RHOB|nr:hypothetical protein GCM10011360_00410 [Primorskyibacter flagellatus]
MQVCRAGTGNGQAGFVEVDMRFHQSRSDQCTVQRDPAGIRVDLRRDFRDAAFLDGDIQRDIAMAV